MHIVTNSTARFRKDIYGNIFTDNPTLRCERLLKKYGKSFNKIILVIRAKLDNNIHNEHYYTINNDRIITYQIKYYEGILGYLVNRRFISKQIKYLVNKYNYVYILRLPCIIGFLIIKNLKRKGYPYAVEIVGDPYSIFTPSFKGNLFRNVFINQILRYYLRFQLKKACKNAIASLYVTKHYLQEKYPCPEAMFSASNAELLSENYSDNPRIINGKNKYNLIFIGTLNQLYKAPDVLIKAMKICVDKGLDLTLSVLGDGKYRPMLEELTSTLNIRGRVIFHGNVSRDKTLRLLEYSDVFILPSLAEGLPRAMLEAMAKGLPCIGTNVGGIPELLPPEDLVPPGNVEALANKIIEILNDDKRMNEMSKRNLAKAREYSEAVQGDKRGEFFEYVKKSMSAYLEHKSL